MKVCFMLSPCYEDTHTHNAGINNLNIRLVNSFLRFLTTKGLVYPTQRTTSPVRLKCCNTWGMTVQSSVLVGLCVVVRNLNVGLQ